MSGRDGLRGYMVQALVAILYGVDSKEGWQRVEMEPDLGEEKADIVWHAESGSRAVEIKSSQNAIDLPSVRRWVKQLRAVRRASRYELVLLGPCSGSVASEREIDGCAITTGVSWDIVALI